jgi:hypothetical protein
MEDNKDIELRSEEFQEVLSAESPWILKWGILIILTIICLCLFVSTRICYSNSLKVPLILVSKSSKGTILFPVSGTLVNISVIDRQKLNKGDFLFAITTEKQQQLPIHAASTGIIRYSQDWKDGIRIYKNQIFGYITNNVMDKYVGHIVVHSTKHINVRQKVYVIFPNNSEKVEGTINYVASAPFEVKRGAASYLVTVNFPYGLVSTKDDKFSYYPGMQGEGTILTDEESLFDRLLNSVFKTEK